MQENIFLRRLGFTTKTFMKAEIKGVITNEESIRWAADKGFKWVELRDDNLQIDTLFLQNMAALSKELGIRIHYAWDGNEMLDDGNEKMFIRGLKNAQIFGQDGYSRITLSKIAFSYGKDKKGYTKDEFERLCNVIDRYENISKDYGVSLVYENSMEPVEGDGSSYYGMRELMEQCKEMKMTFDIGNFTNKNQVNCVSSPNQVKDLFNDFKSRIPYIHLKSTKDNKIQNILLENGDMELEFIIKECSEESLLCIELPGLDDLEQCKSNVENALKLLVNKYR